MSMNIQQTANRTLLSMIIWALAGSLFGGLFAGATETFQVLLDSPAIGWIPATALAGAITASYFGAIRAATTGTMMGVLSGVVYLMLGNNAISPMPFLVTAFFFALIFTHHMPAARFPVRPLGQAVSGLLAGLVVGILLSIKTLVFGELEPIWMAFIAIGMVGIGYSLIARPIVERCSEKLSKVGGPLVSGVIASTIFGIIWLLIHTTPAIDGSVITPEFENVFLLVPLGALGGAIGGAIGGALLGLLDIHVGNYNV